MYTRTYTKLYSNASELLYKLQIYVTQSCF